MTSPYGPLGSIGTHRRMRTRFGQSFRKLAPVFPHFNPYSIRNTLVQLAHERRLDAERFKA